MDLLPLLQQGKQRNASDLHLSAGIAPMLRINGDLTPMEGATRIGPDAVKEALTPYLSPNQRQFFDERKDIDFSFGIDTLDQRFRVNLFRQQHGTSAVLRYIPNNIP